MKRKEEGNEKAVLPCSLTSRQKVLPFFKKNRKILGRVLQIAGMLLRYKNISAAIEGPVLFENAEVFVRGLNPLFKVP